MKQPNTSIKAHGFGLSGFSLFYISIIYITSILVLGLLMVPLTHFFPLINDLSVAVICLLPTILFAAHILLSSFYRVVLTADTITLSWLYIPIRQISADGLQIFCAVGNGREDVLCLTFRTVEEMAFLEERHLLRNYFTKHDVPFLKKKSDWKDVLAIKYLNRMRRSPLGIFRDKRTLFIPMDPVLQHHIHGLYPQLPYKNYTGIPENNIDLFLNKATTPYFGVPFGMYFVEFHDDEITLQNKKEIKRRIPFKDIKTIVRVDIFKPYDKHSSHHVPVLFLSIYSPEEMGAMAKTPEDDPVLRTYRYAEREAHRWTINRNDCCNLQYTAEVAAKLHSLCQHAEWVDISDDWISDHS